VSESGPMAINVHDLASASAAYWSAQSRREEQAAYHEVILFGGQDGWHQVARRGGPSWRGKIARWLRIAALWIEKRPLNIREMPVDYFPTSETLDICFSEHDFSSTYPLDNCVKTC
jgi:hypothetical protein